MKSRFSVSQAQVLKEETYGNNKQVELLIEKFNNLHETYFENAYKVLCDIVKIRQRQIKKYTMFSLVKEKGLNLNRQQIKYIFVYRFFTKETKEKIDSGVFKTSTGLFLLKQSSRFQEPKLQNELVNKLVKGKITLAEVSFLSADTLITGNIGTEDVKKINNSATLILMNIRKYFTQLKTIKKHTDKNILNQIKNSAKAIYDLISEGDLK